MQKHSTGSLGQVAYRTLKMMIMNNEITPGRFYLEQELAVQLGMSRTPLKEAFVRLENEGLLQITPRHGVKVLPLSADDMQEIYQVITSLECEAVNIIAQKGLSDKEITSLENTAIKMDFALQVDDLTEWAKADEDFHRLLIEYCGNQRLKQTVLTFWDQAHRARFLTLHLREKPVNSTKDHQNVIEAIKVKDPQKAVGIHRNHRVKGGEILVGIIGRFRLDNINI